MEGKFSNPILQSIFEVVKSVPGDIDKACAKWTAEHIEEIRFKDIPPKPDEVIAHEKIPYERRKNWGKEYYDDHRGVMPYYRLVDSLRRENTSIYDWLYFCIKKLADDPAAMLKIHEKISQVNVGMLWPKGGLNAYAAEKRREQANRERRGFRGSDSN